MSTKSLRLDLAPSSSRRRRLRTCCTELLEIRTPLASDLMIESSLLEAEPAVADYLLVDVYPGSDPSDIFSFISLGYAELNGVAYFAGIDDSNFYSLWQTDGTTAGTEQVVGFPAFADIRSLQTFGNLLYFEGSLNGSSYELYATDGTAQGTVQLTSFQNFFDLVSFDPVAVGNTVYFTSGDGFSSTEIWKTDGTAQGTMLVKDLTTVETSPLIAELTPSGNLLYFQLYDQQLSSVQLWRTDGTDEGTFRIGTGLADPSYLTDFGGALYFSASDAMHGEELWMTDGTEMGTTLAFELVPGVNGADYNGLRNIDGTLYFSNTTGDIWKSDGTLGGTVAITAENFGIGATEPLLVFQGDIYFSLYNGDLFELWKATDVNSSPELVTGLSPLLFTFQDLPYAVYGDALFFTGYDVDHGLELWKTDGTAEGTVRITDLTPMEGDSFPFGLTFLGDNLLFIAKDTTSGFEPRVLNIDAAPIAMIQLPKTTNSGLSIELSALGSYDFKDAVADLTFEWDLDGDGQYDDAAGFNPTVLLADQTFISSWDVSVKVTDLDANSSFATMTFSADEVNLTLDDAALTVSDGDLAVNGGKYFDAFGRTIVFTPSLGDVIDNGDGTWTWNYVPDADDIGTTAVTIDFDNGVQVSQLSFDLTVLYADPVIETDPQSPEFALKGELATKFGTYTVGSADILSITATLGDITDNGDGTWSWSYQTSINEDDYQSVDITITDVNGNSMTLYESLFTVYPVQVHLTINDAAATTNATGVVTTLPDDLGAINEWDPFTVNVWIERNPTTSSLLQTIDYTLGYNDAWFQLDSSASGAGFSQMTVNDVGGQIEVSASNFADLNGGNGDFLLIGSFRFIPNPNGGVPNTTQGAYADPVDLGFSIIDLKQTTLLYTDIPGVQSSSPTTQVEVIPYDIDDDGAIGLVDLTYLIGKIGDPVATTPASYPFDFDRDGFVSLIDLVYLIRNIGATQGNGVPIQFPTISSSLEAEPLAIQSTSSSLLEGEALPLSLPVSEEHNIDAAFGNLNLFQECWESPSDDEEEVDIEAEFALPDFPWQPDFDSEWAIEASSIVECVIDKAISLLEDLEEEHPQLGRAADWLKHHFGNF
ncbi:hypothetical protein LOC68_17025 [Blastopirellula sp. JC732]|uniref:Dockerin domain-containing protein n=1 Tax=Blastopirellula sediminis TaxID=2894196 RepID=A0A9X1MMX8_9BACT|nr:hypothetical protein [Blastopirellula sediminis]MCC9606605.1 hypothetical protein [Blastopirellula sediminis]MCC9630098.1 hypothetical protein [Blastopirellula sediminis]